MLQEFTGPCAAGTAPAYQDNLLVFRYFVQPVGQLAERNMAGAGNHTLGDFVVLPHVYKI